MTTTAAERAAHARWKLRRYRLIGYGQWQPFVEAEPVRAYVRALKAANMPLHCISARTGVDRSSLDYLLYGKSGHAPSQKIRTETAEKLLAFRPTLDDYPDCTSVDSTGSRRRLQALATLGWTALHVADRYGFSQDRVQRVMVRPTNGAATARMIRDAYNELWSRQPTEAEIPDLIARRTRARARTAGWASPLAWDEETIDDPKAKAMTGHPQEESAIDESAVIRVLEGERIPLTGIERTAAVEYGIRIRGMDFDAVAQALEMELDTVRKYWERCKKRARARGEAWPNSPQWTVAA